MIDEKFHTAKGLCPFGDPCQGTIYVLRPQVGQADRKAKAGSQIDKTVRRQSAGQFREVGRQASRAGGWSDVVH